MPFKWSLYMLKNWARDLKTFRSPVAVTLVSLPGNCPSLNYTNFKLASHTISILLLPQRLHIAKSKGVRLSLNDVLKGV